MKNNNKLDPVEKAIIDQLFNSTKVYVSQFKKTPNVELAELVKIGCKELRNRMNKYIRKCKREKNKKIKVNKG